MRLALSLLATTTLSWAQPFDVAEERPRYMFELALTGEFGLSKDRAWDPISVAPDIAVVPDGGPRFEVIHSSAAFTGFHGIPLGVSACVSGDACDNEGPYHNAGIEIAHVVRSHARGRSVFEGVNHAALSVHGGLLAYSFDPFALAIKAGARVSYLTSDLMQVQLVPSIHISVSDRDALEDLFFVPLTITVLPSEKFTMQLETGIAGPFDEIDQKLQIPLGLNLNFATSDTVDLLIGFSFPAMYGGDAIPETGTDARVLTVGFSWSKFFGDE